MWCGLYEGTELYLTSPVWGTDAMPGQHTQSPLIGFLADVPVSNGSAVHLPFALLAGVF